MGPQSQRRLTLTGRTHLLQSQSHRKKHKSTGQQTLFGDRAFDPLKDCEVCKGRLVGRDVHRAHHRLCYNKRGGAAQSTAAMEIQKEEKRLQVLFATPLTESEKCSGKYLTKEAVAGCFEPKPASFAAKLTSFAATTTIRQTTTATTEITATIASSNNNTISGDDLCTTVTETLQDPAFIESHKSNRAPLPMLAFAKVVVEKIIRPKHMTTHDYFDGITMTVPPAKTKLMGPECHSTVGQKLLFVDWNSMCGTRIACPRCKNGTLNNDRTNISKNKMLFPIFALEGPPMWCMIMSLTCTCCKSQLNANSSDVLCQLPAHVRNSYPVETKCSLDNKNSHLGKTATNAFDLLMPTCGNGDLCSRLLCHSVNRSHADRVAECYSTHVNLEEEPPPYVENIGYYVACCPPLGDSIRDAYDAASSNSNTPYGISDHDRHVREIQAVSCQLSFAQNHTHEVCKNYFQKRRIGANALWDVATETGAIASAALVPSTKASDFAHAAMSLTRRPTFQPSVMHSDAWPAKSDFWNATCGNELQGRLGLFHFIQRMTRTLKKNHIDHFQSITSLLNCICACNNEDHDNLLQALKEGTLSTKHSDEDTLDLKASILFRQRCNKYLRKESRPTHVLCGMLDDWFDRFKCTASDPSTQPARGRKDPLTGETLFTADTKPTLEECKKKACFIQDPLPLEQMYDVVLPSQNSPHQLKECISHCGESCLESFHLMLAHFGNCGMRSTLANNLNLTGTARFNLATCHRRRLITLTPENTARKKIPAACESVVCFFNHSELAYINSIAIQAGASKDNLPFPSLETLPPDNGERFFSECLDWMKTTKPRNDDLGRCLCTDCGIKQTEEEPEMDVSLQHGHCYPNNQWQQAAHAATTTGTTTEPENQKKPEPTVAVHQQPTMTVHPIEPALADRMQRRPQDQQQQTNQHSQQIVQPHQHHQHQHEQQFPMPCMQTPCPPWIATHPTTVMPPTIYCCGRYRGWVNTPGCRGRPPHDGHCQFQLRRRMNQSGGQQLNGQHNPSWHQL